ncbi:MAG: HD domain-containing phosphohydrolase [Dehalococcoidia bacterium]|jgi:PAS domain S-box-containing protein
MQKATKGITKDHIDYLKEIFDAMSDGVYIVNRSCDIEYVNSAIMREFGSPGNQKCYKYFHSRKQVCPWCLNKEVFEGKSVSWRWASPQTGKTYDLFDTPLRNPDGSISKLEFFHEVTDFVKTQEELRISETKYKVLFESLPIGVTVSGSDGQIRECNTESERLLALSQDEQTCRKIDGREWHVLRPDGSTMPPEEYPSTRALKEKRIIRDVELGVIKPDGIVSWINITAAPVPLEGYGVVITYSDIGPRKKAEMELTEANAFLNSMIEQSPTPMWISDDKGTLIRVNKACCRLLNIMEKDVLGRYNIFKDNLVESQGFMPLVENVFREGKVARFELKYDTSQLINLAFENHASLFLDVTIFPIIDRQGKVTNAVIQHIDITGRKTAEEALFKSEDRYRTLVDNAAEGVFVIQNGKVVFANPKAFAMVNYRLDEREPQYFVDFVHPDDRPMVIDRHLRRLSGEEFQETYTIRLIDRHGSTRWIRVSSAGIIWENSPATLTLATDITEHRLDEEKIQESEERYHTLFDNMLNGVAYCQMIFEDEHPQDFIYILVNEAFGKLTGLKDVVGKRVTEVIPGIRESNPELFEIYGRVSLTGKPEKFETFLSTLGIWLSISVYSTAKGYFVALFDNISESKQSQEKLEKSYVALKKTLNDAIDTLSKIVEMRDPYTSGHQNKVAALSTAIASEMKLSNDQIERLRMAATIHDIGKIYVPSDILSKPGKLDKLEFEIIKTHPRGGYDIIKGMDFPCAVAQTVLQHHERLDGSGYPSGLSGKDISIEARILAVADVVEAMGSHRPYRPAMGSEQALAEISAGKGKLYDPEVVDVCLKLFKDGRFKLE